MKQKPHIHIVCSDQTRNGKTLVVRLLADVFSMQGEEPFILDLDAPTGNVCKFYRDSEVFDIMTVPGQVELFDWLLSNPTRDYILDVPARHLDRLFTAMDDIGFLDGARDAGFDVVVFYVVEINEKSLGQARFIHDNFSIDRFITIRRDDTDEALRKFDSFTAYSDISKHGEIVLPVLSGQLAEYIDQPPFSFAAFIKGQTGKLSHEQQLELAMFLEKVVDNIQKIKQRIDIGNLQSVKWS